MRRQDIRQVELLFIKQPTLTSMAIRAMTCSRWCRVAIVAAGTAIEARRGASVCEVPLSDALPGGCDYTFVQLRCARPQRVIEAARSQLGKPYDASAVFHLFGDRCWLRDDRWFGAELVAWSFAHAGFPLFRPDSVHRVTPGQLWHVAQGIPPVPRA